MAQWVKNPVLSLQQLGSLLWCGFDHRPQNFHILQAWLKKKNPFSVILVGFQKGAKEDAYISSTDLPRNYLSFSLMRMKCKLHSVKLY